jgi:aspartate kinase
MLIVKKFGGTSVSTPQKILDIARHLKADIEQGHRLIVVVSAMGHFTDELIALSRQISVLPVQREMDMLLSSGERIAMALLAIALNEVGCPAISFTGSQSGVMTDGSHSNARITRIQPTRIHHELESGKIVIVAGFQGVDPTTKEITTLGRGGSDTTAAALAAHFKADLCEIFTDVDGIHSADPRIVNTPTVRLSTLDYAAALELTFWGARVLHFRSVELGSYYQIPLAVRLSSQEASGTVVGSTMEDLAFTAVTQHEKLYTLTCRSPLRPSASLPSSSLLSPSSSQALSPDSVLPPSYTGAVTAIFQAARKARVAFPQMIYERHHSGVMDFFVALPEEQWESFSKQLISGPTSVTATAETSHISEYDVPIQGPSPSALEWSCTQEFGSITIVGRGFAQSDALIKIAQNLNQQDVMIEGTVFSPLSMTFIIRREHINKSVRHLHTTLVKTKSPQA